MKIAGKVHAAFGFISKNAVDFISEAMPLTIEEKPSPVSRIACIYFYWGWKI